MAGTQGSAPIKALDGTVQAASNGSLDISTAKLDQLKLSSERILTGKQEHCEIC